LILDDCERIFRQASLSESESAFCYAIAPLFKEYEILSLELGRGTTFWRARVIEQDVYPNISDLDYPPPALARQGRLNDFGTPCFYVSTHEDTALKEVGAAEGELVQIAGFRVIDEFPIRIAVIGEFANVQKNGYIHFAGQDPGMTITKTLNTMPRQEAQKKIYIDRFLASVLADPDASANGYMFSRALAQSIYSRVDVDGIAFPSVRDRGGFNVAVLAAQSDRSFHNVCCLVVRMGKPRRFGMVEFALVKSAERLDDNWNFVWPERNKPGVIGMYNMSKEEFEAASRES
jgi:hypothetical protein